MPHVYDYLTGERLRKATKDEERKSKAQCKQDGGRGVIKLDGRSVYVQ